MNNIWRKIVKTVVFNLYAKALISLLIILIASQLIVRSQCKSMDFVKNMAKEFTVLIIVDYKNAKPDYGNGVIFKNEGGNYSVLTVSHIFTPLEEDRSLVKNIQIVTNDKMRYVMDIESIKKLDELFDASIFTFASKNNYSKVKLGDDPKIGQLTYILGYRDCNNKATDNTEFNDGTIEDIRSDGIDGCDIKYNNGTINGMSGSPILNCKGQLIGIHGHSTKERDGLNAWAKDTCKKLDSDFKGDSYGVPVSKFRKYISLVQVTVST